MKETIYTIPVTEAFTEAAGADCPFCRMYAKLNDNSIEFVMGPSYMEDDVRTATNKTGFCPAHMAEMYKKPNRLGLALMVHTHLMEVNRQLSARFKDMPGRKKKAFSPRKKQGRADDAVQFLKSIENSCYICDRTERIFQKYIDTYFFLWNKDDDIKSATAGCGGFCLNHLYKLLEAGEARLNAAEYDRFLQCAVPLSLKKLEELVGDLEWFIDKFDYRNTNEPWKNSKDALIRALKKISCVSVEQAGAESK